MYTVEIGGNFPRSFQGRHGQLMLEGDQNQARKSVHEGYTLERFQLVVYTFNEYKLHYYK